MKKTLQRITGLLITLALLGSANILSTENEARSDKSRKGRRRKKVDFGNLVEHSRVVNGTTPSVPFCSCVDTSKLPLRPLRWLHIPKCGTSLGISLLYYCCRNVPDSFEVRIAHGRVDARAPQGSTSTFDYGQDCVNQDAFISNGGNVGSHEGLNLNLPWDNGLSQGRTVAFFRLPAQRMISAFWHALHADGMAESSHKDMHTAIYGLKRKISRWRVRVANISLSTLQRQIQPEILPEYREAMSIYFHWPGVQGCMTKMVLGYRCGENVTVSAQDLAIVNHRVTTHFAFIGLTEEWDTSICLFHQMLGGRAREAEFVNFRAGRIIRDTKDPELLSQSSVKYDTSVLDGIEDAFDEHTYRKAVQMFRSKMDKYATCPGD